MTLYRRSLLLSSPPDSSRLDGDSGTRNSQESMRTVELQSMHSEWKYSLVRNQNTGIQHLELPLPGTRKPGSEVIDHSAVWMSTWNGKWGALKDSS